jgi:hypothetical protein
LPSSSRCEASSRYAAEGAAADAALVWLRQSRERALTAAAQAKRTGAALTWLGSEVLAALDGHLAAAAQSLPMS